MGQKRLFLSKILRVDEIFDYAVRRQPISWRKTCEGSFKNRHLPMQQITLGHDQFSEWILKRRLSTVKIECDEIDGFKNFSKASPIHRLMVGQPVSHFVNHFKVVCDI